MYESIPTAITLGLPRAFDSSSAPHSRGFAWGVGGGDSQLELTRTLMLNQAMFHRLYELLMSWELLESKLGGFFIGLALQIQQNSNTKFIHKKT